MKRNPIIIVVLSAIFVASLATSAYCAYTTFFAHTAPMDGTVPVNAEAQFYMNNTFHANGSTYHWGNLTLGTNTLNVSVYNTGNVNLTVTCAVESLPTDWTLTFPQGSTAYVNSWLNQTMTLTVPLDAEPDNYVWNCTFNAAQET